MRKLTGVLTTLLLLGGLNTSLFAQEDNSWDWRITPYLWGVNVDGTMAIGQIENDMDVSFSDILSNLDFGGSVFAQVGKGKHAFHADYTYLRLTPDVTELPSPPFPSGSTITPKMTLNIFEAGYMYRLDAVSLVFGARYNDIAMKLTPELTGPGPIDPDPLSAGPTWWDGFVGIYSEHNLSAKWDFRFYGTVGAGGSDFPWTLQGMFGRKFSNDNRLAMGFRVWGIDFSDNDNNLEKFAAIDATFYGFLVGYEFN